MNNTGNIEINIEPSFFNETYIQYLGRKEKFQVFYGGAGSGKSYFIVQNLLIRLLKQKQKLMVVRQTFNTHRDSTFAEFRHALDVMGITEHTNISRSTLDITLPNGSEIIFKGADEESKLLSIQGVSMTWIEEATEVSKEIFDQLVLRMRGGSLRKHMFLSFNPISATHWLKEEFFDNPREDSFVSHTNYEDNRFLEQDYIDNLLEMKERNPLKYDVYALGKWGTTGKKVYDNWEEMELDRYELLKNNIELVSAVGLDFGYIADPTVMVVSLVDLEKKEIYIIDEMHRHGLLNNEIAHEIIASGYGREVIIADSAERKSIDEIKSYGVPRIEPAKKGGGSVMQGVQFLNQFKIYVDPSCVHTIDELDNYSYKQDKRTGKYINEPVDNFNHILDALRYSMEPYHEKNTKKIKVMSKSILGL